VGKKLRGSSFLQRRPGASRKPSQKAASRDFNFFLFWYLGRASGPPGYNMFRAPVGCIVKPPKNKSQNVQTSYGLRFLIKWDSFFKQFFNLFWF